MSDKKLDTAINQGLQSAKDALAEKMIHMAHKETAKSVQETVYNVTFTGVFTKDEKLVVAAMAKFFKQGQEATKRLLKPGRVIKSFSDKGPADKLAKMLNGIGLSCKVDMEVTGGEEEQKAGTLLEKAAFKLADSKTPEVKIPKLSKITWKVWLALGVVLSLIVGAGVGLWLKPPVVKGDSFASYKASIQKVIERAPEEKRAAIQKAVDTLTGAGSSYHNAESFGGSEAVAAGVVYAQVDGMTADEILVAAEADMENRRNLFRQEIDSIKKAIADENNVIAELKKSNTVLEQLIISEARFSWTRETPEMMIKLTNQSAESITKILFQGYLHDANGALLVSEPLTYQTAMTIPPRGFKYPTFIPQANTPWATEEVRKKWSSAKFTLSIESAVNAKGEVVGVDLRPNRKKIAEHNARIKRLEKDLAGIKL